MAWVWFRPCLHPGLGELVWPSSSHSFRLPRDDSLSQKVRNDEANSSPAVSHPPVHRSFTTTIFFLVRHGQDDMPVSVSSRLFPIPVCRASLPYLVAVAIGLVPATAPTPRSLADAAAHQRTKVAAHIRQFFADKLNHLKCKYSWNIGYPHPSHP